MATGPCACDFSRALVIAVVFRESDWFIALFAPAVIGLSFVNGFSTGQQLNAKSAQRSTGNQKQDKKMHNSGRVFCNCSNANLRQNVLITCLYFFSVLNLAHIRCHLHGERKKKTNFRRNASKQII